MSGCVIMVIMKVAMPSAVVSEPAPYIYKRCEDEQDERALKAKETHRSGQEGRLLVLELVRLLRLEDVLGKAVRVASLGEVLLDL